MGIITLIVSAFFLIYFIRLQKEKCISPFLIFYAIWTFIILLSNLNLYNINKPSSESYLLILLMEVFFFMGHLLGKYVLKGKIQKKVKEKYDYKPIYIIIYILAGLSILLNIIDCVIVFREYISGVPMWQIRNWTLEPFGSINPILSRRSFLEELIRTAIITPFNLIIYPISAYSLFHSKEKAKKISINICALIILFTSSLAGAGGRLGFIYFFGCYLLAFILYYQQNKRKNKYKEILKKYWKIIAVLGGLGLIIVFAMTVLRTGPGNFIKQIYTYFALAPTLLSEWLPFIKAYPHTYGLVTFFGIHSYFFRFLEKVGLGMLVPDIYNTSYQAILNAEIFKNVGYGSANAFVSPIYYFMIDGGYIFVCLASLFFGILLQKFFTNFNKNISIRSFSIYMLVVYGVFVSFMRIQTAIPSYIIAFILCYFLFYKERGKNEKE